MRALRFVLSGLLGAGLTACSLIPGPTEPPAPIDGRHGNREQIVSGDPATGRRLIKAIECGVCHQIPGIPGANGVVGPPLQSFAQRPFIAGIAPNRPAILLQFIQNAPSIAPNTAMPSMPVSDQEARHIAAYLYTLR